MRISSFRHPPPGAVPACLAILFLTFFAPTFLVTAAMAEITPEIRQLEAAANQGDAVAQVRLGWLYEYGDRVPPDFARAVTWYQLAANLGDARGRYELGMKYYDGKGVKRDYEEALR
ncbi:MAG: sel1 repeat family protein, partial [Proteobacteria bacterium]|nr:sel1 repeat family protein [Pseudomonadota bacterium]